MTPRPTSPGLRAGMAPEPGDQLLRRLRWTVLRPIAARFGGDERSLLRGSGMELTDVREYQPGDDVRLIDWNVTARTGTTFVRETQAERAIDAWLLVDVSASIEWGTATCLKRDRAVELAAVAGQVLGSHGNRIGALLFADRPLTIVPPGAGRPHLVRLLSRLQSASAPAGTGPTDLTAAVMQAQTLLRRRSLVLLISDFLVPDGWLLPLRRLAVRHEVVAARLTDPRESELPDVGLLTLEDPETRRQLIVDTGNRHLRERFRAAAAAQAERAHADLTSCGVDHFVIGTDGDLLTPLVRFLDARRQRRSLRGAPAATPALAQGGVA